MSATLTGAAFYLPIPKAEKLLLVAMADHANDDGAGVYPGNRRLQTKTSDSERNVRRLLRRLEDLNLITAVANPGGGRGLTTEYALNAALIHNLARANGWHQKTRRSTAPFTNQNPDTTRVKGDTTAPKGGHQAPPNHNETSITAGDDVTIAELNPRKNGEPLPEYLARLSLIHKTSA